MSDAHGEELHGELEVKLSLQGASEPQDAWQDVTQLLGAAAKELKVGQMVHVEDFNLFDSMSALELMDPKMDSGMLVNGAPPQTITARLADGHVALDFASARDVLATLDELFRCEAGWLTGLPLAQSLLTSVYMHRDVLHALLAKLVTPLEELVLSEADVRAVLAAHVGPSAKDTLLLVMCAVCLAMMKTGNLVRDAVLRADIYEEEDFSPGTGFDLGVLTPLSVEAVDVLLAVTQERLELLLLQHQRATSSKKAKKKKKSATATPSTNRDAGAAGYELLYSNARVGGLLCEALVRRIRLRRELLATYAGLGLVEGAVDLQQAREGFQRAQELVRELSTEQLELDRECFSGKSLGFDSTISRLLLSGSPPRDVKVPTTDEALATMTKVLSEVISACSPGEWTGMEDLRLFLAEFSRQQPSIVARSYVLLFLYADKKIYAKYNFMEWLSASMVLNGVPSVLLSTQEGVLFSSRSIETVYESLKVFLHNRSRQRARIDYLLEEWAVLQVEAAAVDDKFTTEMSIPKAAYPRYFTAWSLEETVQLMIQYVVLGLDLELYAPSELGTVYWYLDYLHGSRLQNLSFTWSFVEKMKQIMPSGHRSGDSTSGSEAKPVEVAASAPETPAPGKGSKKDKNKHKKHPNGGPTASPEPVEPTKARFLREIKYTEMLRSLTRAYFQLLSALEREQLVQARPPQYSTLAIRFQHRFAAFRAIHFPAALTYEDFCQNSDFSPYELGLIYKSAEECFKAARAHAEALLVDEEGINTAAASDGDERRVRGDEIQALLKVAISNCVRLAQRSQAASGGKARKPAALAAAPSTDAKQPRMAFDFSLHPHFPVVTFPSPQKP